MPQPPGSLGDDSNLVFEFYRGSNVLIVAIVSFAAAEAALALAKFLIVKIAEAC